MSAAQLFPYVFSFALLVIAHGGQVWGQSIIASQELDLTGYSDLYLLGQKPEGLVVYAQGNNKAMLSRYDDQMQTRWDRELLFSENRPNPIGAMVASGQTHVFYTYRKDNGLYLMQHEYATNGNLKDSTTLTELIGEYTGTDYEIFEDESGNYATLVRRVGQRKLVLIGLNVQEHKLMYSVLINEDAGQLPIDATVPVFVDRNGYSYVIAEENNSRSRRDNHQVVLYRVGPDAKLVQSIVDLPDTLTTDLKVAVDYKQEQVIVAGYCATDGTESDGAIVFRFPYATLKDPSLVISEFSEELITTIESDRRKPEDIEALVIENLTILENGTAILWGEQQEVIVRTMGGRGGYMGDGIQREYQYGDILIMAISPKGEVLWQETLPKKQVSQDDDAAFSGFFLATSPRAARLIYNDDVRGGSTISAYTVSGMGRVRRKSLFNTEYRNLHLRPTGGHQLSGNTVIIPSQSRSRFRLVRIEF